MGVDSSGQETKIYFHYVTKTCFFFRLLQDVRGATPGLCDACIAKKKMLVTWGQSIHLGCAVKLPRPISLKDITWHHYSKDKGKYQIRYR